MTRLGFLESSFYCSLITIGAIMDEMFTFEVISHQSCTARLITSQLLSAFFSITHNELTLVERFLWYLFEVLPYIAYRTSGCSCVCLNIRVIGLGPCISAPPESSDVKTTWAQMAGNLSGHEPPESLT